MSTSTVNGLIENLSSTPLTIRVEISPSFYLEGKDVILDIGETKEVTPDIYFLIRPKLLQLESLGFLRIIAEPSGGDHKIDLQSLRFTKNFKRRSEDDPTTLL